MTLSGIVRTLVSAALLCAASVHAQQTFSQQDKVAAPAKSDQTAKLRIAGTYGRLPLSFAANQGQTDPQVKFLSRGNGYSLFLTPTEAVLALQKPGRGEDSRPGLPPNHATCAAAAPGCASAAPESGSPATVLRMKLVGGNASAKIAGADELPGKSNYFIGNDPSQWRTNVSNYSKVEYRGVYPGVDLIYYGNQRQLEHDFVVAPGADPKRLLAFKGAAKSPSTPGATW